MVQEGVNATQFLGILLSQSAEEIAEQSLGLALIRKGKTLKGHGISVFS